MTWCFVHASKFGFHVGGAKFWLSIRWPWMLDTSLCHRDMASFLYEEFQVTVSHLH
jgi:hypothetical protein